MVNYIGSKKKLSKKLIQKILEECEGEIPNFAEGFAGTGALSKLLPESDLIFNDIENYSVSLLKGYYSPIPENLDEKLDELNSLPGVEGLIFKNYSPDAERMFFTEENAKKIDAIRLAIKNYPKQERRYFLACLLEATDKVANVASVYGAFLKKWKRSALEILKMVALPIITRDEDRQVTIYNRDVKDFVKELPYDSILYLDPPYNSRHYGANYFVLNVIAEYPDEMEFEAKGKTGIPASGYFKSDFCQKNNVEKALLEVLSRSKSKFCFLSYNNEGLLSKNQILSIFERSDFQNIKCFEFEYKKFKSNRNADSEMLIEYLFVGRK